MATKDCPPRPPRGAPKNANASGVPTSPMELLILYHQNPSIALRNQIVQRHGGLVRKIAHRLSLSCPEPYEDLEHIGYIGLIRAVERFNPSLGRAFSSFAVPYIRGEMLHFLRDRSGVVKIPRRWRDLEKNGEAAQKTLSEVLGRPPQDAEIASFLQISLHEWRQILLATRNCKPLSLDATVVQSSFDGSVTLADTLIDTNYQLWQYRQEETLQLQVALGQLEVKTRSCIESVFFQDMPRYEVAKCMGVSPMTIGRWIHQGINQLVFMLQVAPVQSAS